MREYVSTSVYLVLVHSSGHLCRQHGAWVSRITFTHTAPSPHTNTHPHLFNRYKNPSITYSWENWYALYDTSQSNRRPLKVYTVLDGHDKGQAYLYWWMPFATCCQVIIDMWLMLHDLGRWTDYPKQKDRVTYIRITKSTTYVAKQVQVHVLIMR